MTTPINNSMFDASYSRFSCDLQDETSIDTQQAKCREYAAREGRTISKDLEFADLAISGTTLRRAGLDACLEAASTGRMGTLYFLSLSRLARESVITMPILKQLVYVDKVRIVSITEGVDSDRDGWDLMAMILSMQHERYIKELSANVLRGQEANIEAGFSNGDYCFGYTSVPVPGSETTRRGRHRRPRMDYVIDQETTRWVKLIFHWYVVDRRTPSWIARELNGRNAPKDHRATTKRWRSGCLPSLLRNAKYIGLWPWGKNRNARNPLTGKITQEERPAEECEKWLRHRTDLQIIENDVFERAQKLLQDSADKYAGSRRQDGKLHGSPRGAAAQHPRHLLSGLVFCRACGATFYAGGTNGKYLFCPRYKQGLCTCQTTLRRDRAERLILHAISERILTNPLWLKTVFEKTSAAWQAKQRTLPAELHARKRELADVENRITKLVDRLEEDKDSDPAIKQRLAARRARHSELLRELDWLQHENEQQSDQPTEDWIRKQIQDLASTLQDGRPAAAHALHKLVGGRIIVEQVERPGRKRHYLRGSFAIRTQTLAATIGAPLANASEGELEELITIDFVDRNPLDEQAERAKQFWDQGLLNKQIAAEMKCSRSNITKLLKHWSMLHHQSLPSGKKRRSMLTQKYCEPAIYQQIGDDVLRLMDEGLLLQEIANQLGYDRGTITKAANFARQQRGLPKLDGRSRRKDLTRKSSGPRKHAEEESGP